MSDLATLTRLDPRSPEGKVMYALCDGARADQLFLTVESIGRSMRLHPKLVEDALHVLAQQGLARKKPDLTRHQRFNWLPTFAGYQALYGEEQAGILKAKVLIVLEQATRHLPDAQVTDLARYALNANYEVIIDLLRELERQDLAVSQPSLAFPNSDVSRRWQLTGQGARVLEQTRQESGVELGY